MLCERCKKTEATVHVTEIVAGSPGEMKKTNLCEACFSLSKLSKKVSLKTAGTTSYGPTKTFKRGDEPGR
jgi:protein-arginine kinase activator protein McsA